MTATANGSASSPAASPAGSVSQSTNVWDFLRALSVVLALGFLTWFIVRHFGDDAMKATTVLGVIVPVLAAIVGTTLGYYTGAQTGQAQTHAATAEGETKAQQAAKAAEVHLASQAHSLTQRLEGHIQGITEPVERHMISFQGTRMFTAETLQQDQDQDQDQFRIDGGDLAGAYQTLGELKGLLAGASSRV